VFSGRGSAAAPRTAKGDAALVVGFGRLLRVHRLCIYWSRRRIKSQIEADNVAREANGLGHTREDIEHPRAQDRHGDIRTLPTNSEQSTLLANSEIVRDVEILCAPDQRDLVVQICARFIASF
jgi:hypothetical protein